MTSGASVNECLQYSKQNPTYIYYIPAAFFFQQGHFYYRGEIVDDKMDEFANQAYANQIAQETQQKKENEKSAVANIICLSIFLAFLTIACVGVWSGYTDRAIFYHSVADAIISAISIVGGFIVICIIIGNNKSTDKTIPIMVSCLIALASLAYNGYMSFKHNSDLPPN